MTRGRSTQIELRFLQPVLLLVFLSSLWLGGCASQKDVSILQRQVWNTRRDLDKSKAQIAELEKALDKKLEELEDERQPLRRNQAAVGAQLDEIQLELGRIDGQLEEVAATNSRNRELISGIQQNQMESMLEIRKSVVDLQRAVNVMAGYVGMEELVVSTPVKTQVVNKTAKTEAKEPSRAQTANKQTVPDAQGLYDSALLLFRSGQYESAREKFSHFLQLYPKTDLADNAQFWLGECYYAEKKYRQAIAAYEKTISEYPKSAKTSSAMLKQGMAFLELGDSTAGKILLKKVIKNYPESNQAKIAKSKLARIK